GKVEDVIAGGQAREWKLEANEVSPGAERLKICWEGRQPGHGLSAAPQARFQEYPRRIRGVGNLDEVPKGLARRRRCVGTRWELRAAKREKGIRCRRCRRWTSSENYRRHGETLVKRRHLDRKLRERELLSSISRQGQRGSIGAGRKRKASRRDCARA